MIDIHHNHAVVPLTAIVVATSDVTPNTAVDLQGNRGVDFVVSVGASGDTLSPSVKIELIIEASEDNSSYTAVTSEHHVNVSAAGGTVNPDGSGIVATIDGADLDERVYRVGYVGGMGRYVRIRAVLTGSHSSGTPIQIFAILHPQIVPVS